MRFFKNTRNNHIYSIVELQKTEDQSDYTMIDLSTNAHHPYFDSICYAYGQKPNDKEAIRKLLNIFNETADHDEKLIPLNNIQALHFNPNLK